MSEKTSRKGKLRELTIDDTQLQLALENPYRNHPLYPCSGYLDLESGEIMWLFSEDEGARWEWNADPAENAAKRRKVQEFLDRYLNIFEEMVQNNDYFNVDEFYTLRWKKSSVIA